MERSFGAPNAVVEHLLTTGKVTAGDLERARELQRQSGGDLAWILGSLGAVTRRDVFEALSEVYGIPLVRDIERLRTNADPRLAAKMTYDEVVQLGFMPFAYEGETLIIITASPGRSEVIERCKDLFGANAIAELLVTDLDLTLLAARTYRDELVEDAIRRLFHRNPEQSARRVFTKSQLILYTLLALAGITWFVFQPLAAFATMIVAAQIFYLSSILFKLRLSFAGATIERSVPISPAEIATIDDAGLPVYTILVPVYREPEVVGHLIGALKKLDYPQHLLDVILLLEEDDEATLAAARAARPPITWRFIVVPNSLPRTKPKACNYGLVFARGEYLVIYDAEDLPDADQLKVAIAAFRKFGPEFMCFQAALNYFNADENLLTRMFTLEYSYWFDYLVPGLDRLRLPIPLGGTSNHFRVETLRQLGGWDPYNTTEDADLGIRAAAERYRVGFINSTTYEEANSATGNWIRQRSRWIKGYMQTFLVYSRDPIGLIRRIGLRSFVSFALFIGGTPATFLLTPALVLLFIVGCLANLELHFSLLPGWLLVLAFLSLVLGNFLAIYLNMMGVFLRKDYKLAPYALLNPFYWILHSIAAYKALWQLFVKPFYWEKTQHGITRYTRQKSTA
jgi:glycosyltransferase XagB